MFQTSNEKRELTSGSLAEESNETNFFWPIDRAEQEGDLYFSR